MARIWLCHILIQGKDTFYKIKNQINERCLKNSKRITKITNPIKIYIKIYVTRKIIFNYKKLIILIYKNFNVIISKSTIYNILKDSKIKKKIYVRQILTGNNKRAEQIKFFKKQLKNTSIEKHIN